MIVRALTSSWQAGHAWVRCEALKWYSLWSLWRDVWDKNGTQTFWLRKKSVKGIQGLELLWQIEISKDIKKFNIFKSVVQHCCSPYWNVVKFRNGMHIWVIRVISKESKSACFTWFLWYFKVIFSYFNSIILKCRLKTLQKELTNDFLIYFY